MRPALRCGERCPDWRGAGRRRRRRGRVREAQFYSLACCQPATYGSSHNTVTDGTVRAAQNRRLGTVSSVTVLRPDVVVVGKVLENSAAQLQRGDRALGAVQRLALGAQQRCGGNTAAPVG